MTPTRLVTEAALRDDIRKADEAASVAHDYIWPQEKGAVTREEASDAIWTIHEALRPLIAALPERPALDVPPETEAVRRCVTHHACACHHRLAEIGRRYLADERLSRERGDG